MEEYKNLVVDFYEHTMGQAYFNKRIHNNIAYFDLFFRRVPDGGSFVIANGVRRCAKYLEQFHLSDSDVDFLRSLNKFSKEYLEEVSKIRFTGDMYAVEDGTVIFPNEPAITIKAPLLQAQLVETALLLYFNHSSLITTKTNRIVRSADGRVVMEFGTRRAQGVDAAVEGAYAAYIGGVDGTACTETGKKYGVPVMGTMAHSFVQSFDSEFEAFKAYAESWPEACTLLVDTYNTLKSGIPNAIRTHNEVLKPMGYSLAGIRIDSGDLAYLSKQARKMLDEAGIPDAKICTSNSLDEKVIASLLRQGAPIDSFGVGENMITAKSDPVFGGVYKLVAMEQNGQIVPKIKVSDDEVKVINPHFKTIYRLYDSNKKLISDYLTIYNEKAPQGPLTLSHPVKNWVKKDITDYQAVDIRKKIVSNGKIVYEFPSMNETREKVKRELDTLWDEALRLENPHTYTINLSKDLQKVKSDLLNQKLSEIDL